MIVYLQDTMARFEAGGKTGDQADSCQLFLPSFLLLPLLSPFCFVFFIIIVLPLGFPWYFI
ncbi:hypothetical protein BDV29DRAFT_177781 [Aspergillus leporis]|jgi:hypothetical protein|uniref:Uncharacterized protein n=1 Tax=Aspergillus leporis TaxID=41062 RepID=A0A5N5WWW4_9EURO|nr:hypothetical protein BDV29DRAFT_177781 [Aspergillus leporis]